MNLDLLSEACICRLVCCGKDFTSGRWIAGVCTVQTRHNSGTLAHIPRVFSRLNKVASSASSHSRRRNRHQRLFTTKRRLEVLQ